MAPEAMREQDYSIPANGVQLLPRIERLRDAALNAEWGEHGDRASVVQQVFDAYRAAPRKMQIARAVMAVCEQMPIAIATDELIIGRRTLLGYPETEEAMRAGTAEPGYMIADYPRAINEGFAAMIADFEARLSHYDEANPDHLEHIDTLRSMIVACQAAITLAHRHADCAADLATNEKCPQRRGELLELARICRKVPEFPAETFHEALQAFWLTHLAIYIECENVAFSFGRMDQYLHPFYTADIAAGRMTADEALELIQCLWIKTYENVQGNLGHVQTVTVGGISPDGRDGTNQLSWLMQRASRELENVGPSIASRICADTPDDYIAYVLETMRLGRYMPQVYNDDQMVPAITSKGIPLEDAREYGIIGCHEPTICGKGYFRSASWPGYVCFQRWLEYALNEGRSQFNTAGERDAEISGYPTANASDFSSFEELYAAFMQQMKHGVRQSVITANRGEIVKRTLTPRPMMSTLIRGCAEKALDFTEGGAMYNLSGFQAFGIGTCADSLAAIRKLVYEDSEFTLSEFVEILRDNWAGHEDLRMKVRKSRLHFGNDIAEVDELAVRMVKDLENEVDSHRNIRGGQFILGLWSFWQHVNTGKELGASADGRKAGEMLSHSMDPSSGCGLAGPTAAIRSASKIDTSRLANGGSLLLEFQPKLLSSEAGVSGVIGLIRTYFAIGGIQLQLSSVTPEILEAAVENPEQYRHLVVRMAGYCDYFTRQPKDRQAYIIAREKHASA